MYKRREIIYPRVLETSNGKTMLLSKSVICGSKKSFLKEQEASELLSSLDIKIPLSRRPLFGKILV